VASIALQDVMAAKFEISRQICYVASRRFVLVARANNHAAAKLNTQADRRHARKRRFEYIVA
jgi:hypothetical protein